MSHFTNIVKLDVQNGYWYDVYMEAINIAKMLDKNVEFLFNGVQITLNKNSSPECFVKQYGKAVI
ncbi:hypothetical protein [Yersinia phage fHe-Yen9-04]|uniref:Uncharacterized protein n=2 Tax=Eneladusvirus Yen904 TaxID=2560849 RepID=A0A2C9D067_9CAUD|nr:hypothetical protein FDJ41_gp488 [Yersinia phage fHe-Yen9-04]SOK58692.1 hypothetical protein [Yersinia phage fHe-Yen9-04]SOK59226.1 hypothetical protein [Yersinia phage fHe-Yen9-03]VUE36461.1 hypothetical protein [Yersinia phage fHe-Yen9-04]